MSLVFRRTFASTVVAGGKPGCNIVKPVHHTVKVVKPKLKPGFKYFNIPKTDIRSPRYKPTDIQQDRVREHYETTVEPDLLLMNYKHDEKTVVGLKKTPASGLTPYDIFKPMKKPVGSAVETKNIKPSTNTNIPYIQEIVVSSYPDESKHSTTHQVACALQLQQITNCKPKPIYSKKDVIQWGMRAHKLMGAKCVLRGEEMTRFIATLSELVLPRIRLFKGISHTSGDRNGNISIGFTPDVAKFFPEIDGNQDNWHHTYGFHVNFKTTAQTDEQARLLVSAFGIPVQTPADVQQKSRPQT